MRLCTSSSSHLLIFNQLFLLFNFVLYPLSFSRLSLLMSTPHLLQLGLPLLLEPFYLLQLWQILLVLLLSLLYFTFFFLFFVKLLYCALGRKLLLLTNSLYSLKSSLLLSFFLKFFLIKLAEKDLRLVLSGGWHLASGDFTMVHLFLVDGYVRRFTICINLIYLWEFVVNTWLLKLAHEVALWVVKVRGVLSRVHNVALCLLLGVGLVLIVE